jgi:transposase
VPANHPLRRTQYDRPGAARTVAQVQRVVFALWSIAPEKLLRALLLQAFYSVRSERLLMEELQYNLLFRWFVGLNVDEEVWDVTVFTKNRERLLDGSIAEAFFAGVRGTG